MKKREKLSTWAKNNNLSYQTAWNLIKAGKFPQKITKLPTGTILVEVEEEQNLDKRTVIYGRVGSYPKKSDLESQIKLCEEFCIKNGWKISKVYKEIASGMNDNRKKLNELLEDIPDRIVVLHKDRLTRFGFNYLKKTLSKLNCEIVVINENGDNEEDLMKDFISIITSFCCRLYGARRGQSKALKIREEMNRD